MSTTAVAEPLLTVGDWNHFYTTVDDPNNHLSGTAFGGVAKVIINGSGLCSGSLLNTASGSYVLTAAHCVANNASSLTIGAGSSVTFDAPGGAQSYAVNAPATSVHPDWNGNPIFGNDLAVLELFGTPTPAVERYAVYGGTQDVGVVTDKVGYGRHGSGTTGSVGGSAGTKRDGQNIYDTVVNFASGAGTTPDSLLIYDFDDGTAWNVDEGRDASGALGHATGQGADLEQTGLGNDEVSAAPGDSGGPTFIGAFGGPAIAGITSFGIRSLFVGGNPVLCFDPDTSTSESCDIDTAINSTFGEWVVDMRISAYVDWLLEELPTLLVLSDAPDPGPPAPPSCQETNTCPPDQTNTPAPDPVPEPASLAILGLGLAALAVRRRRGRLPA